MPRKSTFQSPRRRLHQSLKWLGEHLVVPIVAAVVSAILIGWLVTRDGSPRTEPTTRPANPQPATPPYPISFTATPDDQTYSDGFSFVASRQVAESLATHVRRWRELLTQAPKMGAVHTSPTLLRLLAEATVPRATIIGMRARVLQRLPKVRGADLLYPGGGEISPVRLTFNLDKENPVALRVRDDGSVAGSYFGEGYGITLRRGGEPTRLAISGLTRRKYVVWQIVADVSVRGKITKVPIRGAAGQPFRTTPSLCEEGGYTAIYMWPLIPGKPKVLHPGAFTPC